jgi:predicted TIM-barrel fold metal-dependent hydrolase
VALEQARIPGREAEGGALSALPAADCHVHVIDHRRFPFAGGTGYTPRPDESGTVEELEACTAAHGLTHALLVQPSGYGYDNRALVDALARGRGRWKGIAVLRPGTPETELRELSDAGVVGLRFNLTDFDAAGLGVKDVSRLLGMAAEMGWFAELQCAAADFPAAAALLAPSRVRLLIDHLAGLDPALGLDQPGFRGVLDAAAAGRAVVKLSGAFRRSRVPFPHADLDPYVVALLAVFTPGACVWGSDWPFINSPRRPDYRDTLRLVDRWLPDTRDRRAVLWETPAALFGFETEDR